MSDRPFISLLAKRIFAILISLKFAVLVMVALIAATAAGTILESIYDTATAQYWVYRAFWFRFVLFLLGLLIFCVAMSRYPWQRRHTPFLLAHLGIIVLLAGGWITDKLGVDGSLRISEGESSSAVQLDTAYLAISEKGSAHALEIPWRPPHVTFRPIEVTLPERPLEIRVDRFLSHAEPETRFIPLDSPQPGRTSGAAIRLKLSGGPMNMSQDFWLWTGDPGWSSLQAGPAAFQIGSDFTGAPAGRPRLALLPGEDGSLRYRAYSSAGKVAEGTFPAGKVAGAAIPADWKGVKLAILEWVPRAAMESFYKASRIQYGQMAPPSAIRVVAGTGAEAAEAWLGLGERVLARVGDRELELGYFPRRVILPFSIRLERFKIDHYNGTRDPMSYSSEVSVLDGPQPKAVTISMNEPLKHAGFTVYQASYEDGSPRPTTSIFSVNRDPGRLWKYAGSLLIVWGSALLFHARFKKRKATVPKSGAPDETEEATA